MPTLERVVVPTVGRIFAGYETCRSPKYIKTLLKRLRRTPHTLKPLVALFVLEIHRALRCLRDIKQLLVPVITTRSEKHKAGDEKRTENLLQFVMLDGRSRV
jgi:hypothetical protein